MTKTKEQNMYDYNVATLKQYATHFKLTAQKAVLKKGFEFEIDRSRKGKTEETEKLENNISRAKSKVFEYAMCNEFENFVTLTIDSEKYDRTDLKKYYKDFGQWLRDYSKKHNIKIEYIFIPELHSDGINWHLHGLIKGLPEEHSKRNENGYKDWLPYKEKFGWISIDDIHEKTKCANYITKYITKNLQKSITEYNSKLYYTSKGLKRAQIKKKGFMAATMKPDYENDYTAVKWSDDERALAVFIK